ncbi:hypothetical protein Q4Q39_04915 [Flavivirga amylovorans]|uniref:Lipoprotein n=1 Tax=Flavivirga amylovorans TaxID=870486 RepID=A0ABT8WYI8_9FLAO|nr:hypothetical protein [Flavivirga amylovorans]MDO5986744.1 hypothetical protein [Flavivirga amylovorans]
MKKLLLFTISLFMLMACGGKKQVEAAVNSGNYDQAITTALNKLRTNKNKKRKFDYVLMLQDAYNKATERDLNSIEHLKKDKNPELYREIYEIYMDLNARQEAIKPILPLNVNGRNVSFKFNDYSNDIVQSRETVSDYLYEKGLDLLELDDKARIREAYNVLNYVESINPNYEMTRDLMIEAHQRGTAYVSVTIQNRTNQIIPQRLEDDLLNFDTYGLNQFWTVYHAQPDKKVAYDYAMQLQLKQINISPEHIKEREFIREREVVDGWEYELDSKGNVVKDSLGNDIKIDKIIRVKARFNEFTQIKSTQVIADVVYLDIKTKQLLDTFTIDSEFIFENLFARVRGDKRALESEDRKILNNRRVPFPSNEQMVYDTGEDLKLKLKDIISSYRVKV